MKVTVPKQLGTEASKYYKKICKELPELNAMQRDLVAMLSDRWETYWTAAKELDEYAAQNERLTVTSGGNIRQHPALSIQKQVLESYINCFRQLRISLEKQPEAVEKLDDLSEFMGS